MVYGSHIQTNPTGSWLGTYVHRRVHGLGPDKSKCLQPVRQERTQEGDFTGTHFFINFFSIYESFVLSSTDPSNEYDGRP